MISPKNTLSFGRKRRTGGENRPFREENLSPGRQSQQAVVTQRNPFMRLITSWNPVGRKRRGEARGGLEGEGRYYASLFAHSNYS